MKLLTKELMQKIPPLYSQEKRGDEAIVYAKFFTPDSSWTWYATEGSWVDQNGVVLAESLRRWESLTETERWREEKPVQTDFLFFGLVEGQETELGYFSLKEMESVRGPFGLPIERDLYWKPMPLKEVRR